MEEGCFNQRKPSPERPEHGADDRIRTGYLLHGKQVLYQMSYIRTGGPEGNRTPALRRDRPESLNPTGTTGPKMNWRVRRDLNPRPPA